MTLPTNIRVLLVDTADGDAVIALPLPCVPQCGHEVRVGEVCWEVLDVVWHLPVSDTAPEVELRVKRRQGVGPWVMVEDDLK